MNNKDVRASVTIFCLQCADRITYFNGMDDPPITEDEAKGHARADGWDDTQGHFLCPWHALQTRAEQRMEILSEEERAILQTEIPTLWPREKAKPAQGPDVGKTGTFQVKRNGYVFPTPAKVINQHGKLLEIEYLHDAGHRVQRWLRTQKERARFAMKEVK